MKEIHKNLFSDRNNTEPLPALVIGVDMSALHVIRSLGRRGIKVYAMGSNPRNYGAVSRYSRFVLCENLYEEEKVVSKLQEIARHVGEKMVLFCTADLHVLYVSRNRDILHQYFEFVLPDQDVIETLMNKQYFNDFAKRQGFCVPQTFFSKDSRNFEKIEPNITYPCVAKPLYRTEYICRHVPPTKKVIKAFSSKELRQELENWGLLDKSLIIQEWIPGGDQQVYFCLAYLDRQGKPLALLSGRKLRQYPSLTGVTSIAESIDHQELAKITSKILTSAGCRGLCSVEFKYNAADNTFRITEPTVGRVDLQEGISTSAGVDIPFLAYQDALGIPQSVRTDYKKGIKWINESFEFNFLLIKLRQNKYRLGDFFRPYHGQRSFALLAADDPVPFMYFLILVCKRALYYVGEAVSRLRIVAKH